MLTTAPAQSPSVLSSLPARHPLVSYFLIAFGFSWLMFLPGPLMYYGVVSLSDDVVRLLAIAGLLGPILSGFMCSLRLREAEWVIGRRSIQCLTKLLRCDDSGIEIAFAPVRLAAHNFRR